MEPSQAGAGLTSSQDGYLKGVLEPEGPAKEDQEAQCSLAQP